MCVSRVSVRVCAVRYVKERSSSRAAGCARSVMSVWTRKQCGKTGSVCEFSDVKRVNKGRMGARLEYSV